MLENTAATSARAQSAHAVYYDIVLVPVCQSELCQCPEGSRVSVFLEVSGGQEVVVTEIPVIVVCK